MKNHPAIFGISKPSTKMRVLHDTMILQRLSSLYSLNFLTLSIFTALILLSFTSVTLGQSPKHKPFPATSSHQQSDNHPSLPFNGIPPITHSFSPSDYAGHSQVWMVAQDSAGLMYFANSFSGLLIFDGFHWQSFALPLDKNLVSFDLAFHSDLNRGAEGNFSTAFAGALGDFGAFLPTDSGLIRFVSFPFAVDDLEGMGNALLPFDDNKSFADPRFSNKIKESISDSLVSMLSRALKMPLDSPAHHGSYEDIKKAIFWYSHAFNQHSALFNSSDKLLFLFHKDRIYARYDTNRFFRSFDVSAAQGAKQGMPFSGIWIAAPKNNSSPFFIFNAASPLDAKGRIALDSLPFTRFFQDKAVYGMLSFQESKNGVDLNGFADFENEDEASSLLFVTKNHGLFTLDLDGALLPDKDLHVSCGQARDALFEPAPFADGFKSQIMAAKPYGACKGFFEQMPVFFINTSQNGLFAFSENQRLLWHMNRESGLRDNLVLFPFFSKEKILWLATNNGINLSLMNEAVLRAGQDAGFEGGIESIRRHKNRLYLATSQGLYRMEDKPEVYERKPLIHKLFSKIKGLNEQSWQLISWPFENEMGSRDSVLLVTSGYSGALVLRKDSVERISSFISRTLVPVYSLKGKYPDMLAVAGKNGFVLLKKGDGNGEWKQVLKVEDLPGSPYAILQTDHFDNIISGSFGDEASDSKQTKKDSLYFWMGTFQSGFLRLAVSHDLKAYNCMKFDTAFLPDANSAKVFSFKGKLALGTGTGLYKPDFEKNARISIKSHDGIHRFFAGSDSTGQVFLLEEGLANIYWICRNGHEIINTKRFSLDTIPFKNLNIGQVNAIHPDPGQPHITWFGGNGGLARFDASIQKRYTPYFPCLVRKVWVNEKQIFGGYFSNPNPNSKVISRIPSFEQPEDMVYQLEIEQNNFRFQYACPIYDYPEKVKYSWFLEGYSEKWSKWEKATYVDIRGLQEGEYKFLVKAKNVYGLESKEGSYRFVVLPPFHRTWWFYSLQAGVWLLLLGVSILMSGGKSKFVKWSVPMATVALIIGFEYAQNIAEEMFANQIGGIIAIKTMLNTVMVFLLQPLERLITGIIRRRQGMIRVFKERLSGFYTKRELDKMVGMAGEEGVKIGEVKGKEEDIKSVAKKLLDRKAPLEQIMKDTGLSREDIEQLGGNGLS